MRHLLTRAVLCCAVLSVSKQVLISRKAGEAVLRGAHVFIPGLVGCSANVSAGDTVAVMIDLGEQGR
jgi:predicted ribosome-associated RNA-binding protein Tma20